MDIHVWQGPEEELVHACHVRKFTIAKLTTKYAEGTITAVDYIEHGIVFTERWEATRGSEEHEWIVKRRDDDTTFWRNRETGEAYFTLNDDINNAMKRFIAEMIIFFMETKVERVRPEKYQGTIHEYDGKCVCAQLEYSSADIPFPWRELTGGRYPQRCFACSCGNKWWNFNQAEHRWAPVDDDKAWTMFMEYNGLDVERVVFLQGHKGFKLLQTLRNEGFIPLG